LVLTIGKHTWESKGIKQVHVLKVEDKMCVIRMTSSFVDEILLLFQIIFIKITLKTLRPITKGKQHACQNLGMWDFTYIENH